jgi:RNA polymerase sigma factor (sigma-70 family)
MALSVCRRVLHNEDDAEDAFQAACLVLAQKASSIGKRAPVAAWLHKVAYRVALRARADLARRHKHEHKAPGRLAEDPLTAITGRELLTVLDEELQRLPELWRAPLILCYLEERTRDEAARQLEVSPRTIEGRLERGRKMLRRRLERRGLALPAALLVAGSLQGTAKAALPGMLAAGVIQASVQGAAGKEIGGMVSAQAAKLAAATLKAMALTKAIKVAAFLTLLALLGTGVSISAYRQLAPVGAGVSPEQPALGARPNDEQAKNETLPPKANDQKELTLTTRVVDDTGKPVPGAEVAVQRISGQVHIGGTDRLNTGKPLAQGQTDRNSQFRVAIREEELSRYRIVGETSHVGLYVLAGKTGYGMAIERIGLDAPGSETVLRLPPETIVRGRVLDLQGQPAAGVEVKVILGLGEYGSAPKIILQPLSKKSFSLWPDPVITDKEGKFTIKGLSARQRVYLSMEGGQFAAQDTEIKFAGQGQVTEVNLTLAPAQVIEGVVTAADTGKPLPHMKFKLWKAGDPRLMPTGETDSEGHYRLQSRQFEKDFWLQLDPGKGPYLRFETKFPWPQGAVRHTLNIALPRGVTVRGKVTEEGTGKPVAGALVEDHDPKGPDRSVKTGPDGIFEIVVAPGSGHLFVNQVDGNYIPVQVTPGELEGQKPSGSRSYPDALISFDAKAGTSVQEVQAKLRPGVSIKGQLLRPDGKPVAEGLMVCWNQNREGKKLSDSFVRVREGRFELRRCDPNEAYSVYFLDAKNELGASVQLSAKEAAEMPVTVRLKPCGKVLVRFVKKNGEPLVGFAPNEAILTRPEVGNVQADVIAVQAIDRIFRGGYKAVVTDKQGRCTIPALIPGATYRFDALGLRSVPSFTVQTGETLAMPDIVVDRPGLSP